MASEPEMRPSPEFDLIREVRERLGGRLPGRSASRVVVGIGDDAAVTVPGGATATSIDAIVEGVHFRLDWASPEAVGHKAMAVALSDLAAMGAGPGEAYVWLGRPQALSRTGCLELADGLAAVARRHGVAILGGDLTAAPALAVAVTVVGHAERPELLLGRSGAAPGQLVCVSGRLGGAGAGLMLLERPELGSGLDAVTRDELLRRHLRPEPRVAAGRVLAAAGATAMIDISDGLGADAAHLAAASGAAIALRLGSLPLAPGVEQVARAGDRDALELAASAGDDYELLCALPRERFDAAAGELAKGGLELAVVGSVEEGTGAVLSHPDGRELRPRGHDHLIS